MCLYKQLVIIYCKVTWFLTKYNLHSNWSQHFDKELQTFKSIVTRMLKIILARHYMFNARIIIKRRKGN